MNSLMALFLGVSIAISVVVGCTSRNPDVLDGGDPLYIAQCARDLPGLACE